MCNTLPGNNAEKAKKELHAAERAFPDVPTAPHQIKWNSPTGSYFTASPLNGDRIAFVYGDGASPCYGLGETLTGSCITP